MTFWHLQLHPNNKNWGKEKELIEKHSLIGLGVIDNDYNNIQNKQFINKMKIDDIVLIRNGKKPIALVRVNGKCEDIGKNDYNRLDWFRYRRKVELLDWADNNAVYFPYTRGTLQRVLNKNSKTYKYIQNWYKQTLQKDYNKNELIKDTYKIKELYIQDFKMFKNFRLDFTSDGKNPLPIIVIAGKNGVGKTTLLEYLANFELKDSDYIEIFKVEDEFEPWGMDELIVNTFKIFNDQQGIQALKKEYKNHIEYLPIDSNKIKDVKEFILQKHRKRSRELDSIKKATKEIGDFIETIFEGLDLSFSLVDVDDTDRENEKVTFKNKNGEHFDINSLSTGEKTLLSKVLYLYFKDLKNKIILIDEPELSLHPAWQNRVLKLYENFAKISNCQIVLATHSPHIIGSSKNEYIRILHFNKNGVEAINNLIAYGRDIEWILQEVMDLSYTRDKKIVEKFNEISNLINSQKFNEAENELDNLQNLIGDSDKDIIKLRNELAFERMELEENS